MSRASEQRRARRLAHKAARASGSSVSRSATEARDIALCERLDGMAGLRNGLRRVASARARWAGIPMPLDGQRLIVEPRYPDADKLMAIGRPTADEDADPASYTIRNEFWSWRWRSTIVVFEDHSAGGKITWGKHPGMHHATQLLDTLGASDAWGIEQEARAVQTLGRMLRHRQFKQYLLTGMFLERSRRSGVHYLFRRLRPTLALTERGDRGLRILAALCLHPIGFYDRSWSGAMCPTDDVIAHLMLARGDEHLFWKRANQIPPYRAEAGI